MMSLDVDKKQRNTMRYDVFFFYNTMNTEAIHLKNKSTDFRLLLLYHTIFPFAARLIVFLTFTIMDFIFSPSCLSA